MDIGLIDDMPAVKAFMSQDEIWERMEDGVSKELFFPSNDNLSQWLYCYDEEKIIGMIFIHHDTSASLKIHPHMLKDYRRKGREMMKELFRWFLKLPPIINKMNVTIPACYKKVINFSKKVGFVEEGINRMSHMKNGNLHNQVNLGLTRKEIEGLI